MSFARLQTRTRLSSAFTLVELMIVIAIVGILASLVTVGVMKALEKGKMVSARLEISQLEAAVAAAKNDLNNVEALPSRIRIAYTQALFSSTTPLTGESAQDFALRTATWGFFQRAFGKIITGTPTTPSVFNWRGLGNPPNATTPVINLEGMDALVFWLGGIPVNGATGVKFTGFAASRTDPTAPESLVTKRKGPYYEFEPARVSGSIATGRLGYNNSYGGAYVYYAKDDYKYFNSLAPSTLLPFPVYPYRDPTSATASSFLNPKTFQIISSGQNQVFGPGGVNWTPGIGKYAIDADGYDDLANFSSTILGKKDE